jgi:PKHD-type hydroxylase
MLTPYASQIEPYAWWDGAFNNEQLDWLQQKAKSVQQIAQVGGAGHGAVNKDIRRSGLSWMPKNQETAWVFETLGHVVSSLNAQFFRFDLTGFGEHIQLTNYDSKENGMYGWHVDMGAVPTSPCRKLSVVMQLSDPSEYEGGDLELKPDGDRATQIQKQRGLIVAFPSWTLHQVTPVTKGSRQSLVVWISGPAFK